MLSDFNTILTTAFLVLNLINFKELFNISSALKKKKTPLCVSHNYFSLFTHILKTYSFAPIQLYRVIMLNPVNDVNYEKRVLNSVMHKCKIIAHNL